jgi:serine/threonine-protein kinase SRPK3
MSVTTDKIHHNLTSQYEYIEGTEDLNNYRPGGYPVLQVGDHLDFDRYKIIHKLGYGGSSTTWLAHDHQTSELVTIKACTHESNARPHEAEYLSLFSDNKFVRRLLASFTLNGPNGSHRCLVMEPATCSLAASKTASFHQLIPLSTARGIIADLIKTVQEFHARGVVHGGK